MAFIPIVDLTTLVAAGQKLDALNFSAYNKVFGAEKTVNVVEGHTGKPKNMSTAPEQRSLNSRQPPLRQNTQSFPSRFKSNVSPNNTNPKPNPQSFPTTSRTNSQNLRPKSFETATEVLESSMAGPSRVSNQSQLTLVEVVHNHTPPPENTCYNCGRFGHHQVMCRQPRNIFCTVCGLKGFPTNFCPFCLKNETNADEKRRLQNPKA